MRLRCIQNYSNKEDETGRVPHACWGVLTEGIAFALQYLMMTSSECMTVCAGQKAEGFSSYWAGQNSSTRCAYGCPMTHSVSWDCLPSAGLKSG